MRMAIGSMSDWGRLTLAAGTAGLGLVNLVAGDFVGRWEPMPTSLPLHRPLAWLSGLALIACGVGLVRRTTMYVSALTLGLFLLGWIVVLHGPLVIAALGDVRTWLYLGEVLAIACAALMLWATPNHGRVVIAARLGFAFSLLTFGASHFDDLKLVASVVPTYVPAPMAVAGLTGAAHIAAGIALLLYLLPRLAAELEATMMSVFVLLVNVPEVISNPTHEGAWTALLAEGALVGAAWIVAGTLRARGQSSIS